MIYKDRDGKEITMLEAAILMEGEERYIGSEVVNGVRVSTVHIPLPQMDWQTGKLDKYFETMIFPGEHQWRYNTLAEAISGHTDAIKFAKKL